MKLVGMVLVASLVVVMQAGVCDTPVLGVQVSAQQGSCEKSSVRGNDIHDDSLQQLETYVHFLKDIYGCTTTNLSGWFAGQARTIDGRLVDILKEKANDRLTPEVTEDLRTAIAFFEKTINHERVIYNPEERRQIKLIITKHKRFIPNHRGMLSFLSFANWLWKQATKVFLRESELKQSLKEAIQAFPAAELAASISSPTLRDICLKLSQKASLDDFFAAWEAVSAYIKGDKKQLLKLFSLDFANQADSAVSGDKIVKDFAGMIAVFMNYTVQYFTLETVEQKALNVEQMLDLYNKVSSLPIVDAIVTLSTLAQQFSSVVTVLQKQDGNLDFGQWLRENWVVFPIVLGVIVVKVTQYFCQQNSGSTLVAIKFKPEYYLA